VIMSLQPKNTLTSFFLSTGTTSSLRTYILRNPTYVMFSFTDESNTASAILSTTASTDPLQVMCIKTDAGMSIRMRSFVDASWSSWTSWVNQTIETAKRPAPIDVIYKLGSHVTTGYQVLTSFQLCAIIQLRQRATLAGYKTDMETQCNRLPGVTA
jgi:hypothetical protein